MRQTKAQLALLRTYQIAEATAMMTRAEKIARNKADKQIDRVYRENCCNIQINMMDIPKVFKVGHEALATGKDLKTAIVEFVEQIRTDKPKVA